MPHQPENSRGNREAPRQGRSAACTWPGASPSRSAPAAATQARARAEGHALGPLARARRPLRLYNQLAIDRWRFLKDYGNGEIGDQGVHQLDIIRWGLGLDDHPTKAQSMGGKLAHPRMTKTRPATRSSSASTNGRTYSVSSKPASVTRTPRPAWASSTRSSITATWWA